jgi:hypothetical protein
MPSLEGASFERYLARVLGNRPIDPASDGTTRRYLVLWAKPWGARREWIIREDEVEGAAAPEGSIVLVSEEHGKVVRLKLLKSSEMG